MPDLEPEQTEHDDSEAAPDVSTEPPADGSEEPAENADDEPTQNMPGGMGFGGFVLDQIEKHDAVSMAPDADELLGQLTEGTDFSSGGLMERLESGEMMLPPDALVSNVSEAFGIPEEDLRAGNFGGDGEADGGEGETEDAPDQPEPPQMADDEETENADDSPELTDAEREEVLSENSALRDEVRRLRTTVVREQCAQRGLDDDATERMLRICHDSGFEAYQHAMEAVDGIASQQPTPEEQSGGGEPETPIGTEQGATGGAPDGDSGLRKIAQEAAEKGLSGSALVRHFRKNGAKLNDKARKMVDEHKSTRSDG